MIESNKADKKESSKNFKMDILLSLKSTKNLMIFHYNEYNGSMTYLCFGKKNIRKLMSKGNVDDTSDSLNISIILDDNSFIGIQFKTTCSNCVLSNNFTFLPNALKVAVVIFKGKT